MAVASKMFKTIDASCHEFCHPWVASCSNASASLFIHSLQVSLRIYAITYLLSLLMKGRKPTKKEFEQTLWNILQSTAFLSFQTFSIFSAVCLLRRFCGKFNILTVAFFPSFLACLVAILIERPSRRGLLSLYTINIALEILYNMIISRGIVKPIPYGDLFIFGSSMTFLLYFYRGQHNKTDSIYSIIRFVVGSSEENNYSKPSPQFLQLNHFSNQNTFQKVIYNIQQAYCKLDNELKTRWLNDVCPHAYGCLHFVINSGTRLFFVGYVLQLCLKSLLQANKVLRKPNYILKLMVSPDTFRLGAFLGGFSTVYKIVSCLMRRFLNKDSTLICIPAGSLASFTFYFYRSNTIALYVMLKALQIMYIKGSNDGLFPDLPQANIVFYSFSGAIIFHAAILEPNNLRPSYWKFLQNLSGESIAYFNRQCLDIFGLKSSQSLEKVFKKFKLAPLQLIKF